MRHRIRKLINVGSFAERKLRVAVVVRTVHAVVLTVAFHDGPHCEELSLALLRRQVDFAATHRRTELGSPVHSSSELVALVESAVDKESCIIVGCLVEREQKGPSRLGEEGNALAFIWASVLLPPFALFVSVGQ